MALKLNPLTGQFDVVLDKAEEIKFDPGSTTIVTAEEVQTAIEELDAEIAGMPNPIYYAGTYDANTNTPDLDLVGARITGALYYVNVAGTHDFGAFGGSITLGQGDTVVYNGTVWEKWDNTDDVLSVNGQTGVVVLDTDDVAEGATNLYFTDERAQDAVGNNVSDTASVDLSYDDISGQITADVIPGGVDHDQLLNYVANEHVDHSTVEITTDVNSGLTGGGDITATRDILVDPNNAPSATVASGDLLLIADVDDTNALKKVTAQSIADLAVFNLATNEKEDLTLDGTDVSNQYVDLVNEARVDSIFVSIFGVNQYEGLDYSVNYTGGVGSATRITFLGDLASGGAAELVAGDILRIQYEYV